MIRKFILLAAADEAVATVWVNIKGSVRMRDRFVKEADKIENPESE